LDCGSLLPLWFRSLLRRTLTLNGRSFVNSSSFITERGLSVSEY
jgi:hypothetical protein